MKCQELFGIGDKLNLWHLVSEVYMQLFLSTNTAITEAYEGKTTREVSISCLRMHQDS